MSTQSNILVVPTEDGVKTVGLSSLGQTDIRTRCAKSLTQPTIEYISGLAKYLAAGNRLLSGEKVACGSWVIRFDLADGYLDAKEANPETDDYVDGVDRAIECWRNQNNVCKSFGTEFLPIAFDGNIAASPGVMEGNSQEFEGIRYPAKGSEAHWYFLASSFSGDYSTVKVHHAYHFMMKYPFLTRFLALPPGYCFNSNGRVWYEASISQNK